MTSLPKIVDNDAQKLKDIFIQLLPQYKHLSIATGYWDMEGMVDIIDSLEHYESIRLLIGREPLLKRDNRKSIDKPELDYPDTDFFNDLARIQPSTEHVDIVKKLHHLIENGKLEVKVYRRAFLHAKCFIFGTDASETAVGVIGSSNFTGAGLTRNTELNAVDSDQRVVMYRPHSEEQQKGHIAWFDEKWGDEKNELWTGKFLELIRTSPAGDLLYSPRQMYLKTLWELYKDEFKEVEDITALQSKTLHDFQEKNISNLQTILDENGVAMLADSVGLGKTVSAIGVIKQYPNQRIIVIAPKPLSLQWKKELAEEGILNVQVLSLQNMNEIEEQQELDKYVSPGLFIIDESHNLRTSNSKRYEVISDWIASPYNENSRVLLLTATPINNSLTDLTNQILLGARGNQDVFTLAFKNADGVYVTRSFYEAIENVRKRIAQAITNRSEKLDEIYAEARTIVEPVIRRFVVRNTRQSIRSIQGQDGQEQVFPDVIITNTPYQQPEIQINLTSQLAYLADHDLETIADTMDTLIHPARQLVGLSGDPVEEASAIYRVFQLILSLSFVPYRWKMYDSRFYGKTKDQVHNLTMSSSETFKVNMQLSLYGIMRTVFLKRFESSHKALSVSVGRYLDRLNIFEEVLREEKVFLSLSDIDSVIEEYGEEDGEREYNREEILRLARRKVQRVNDQTYLLDELYADIELERSIIQEILRVLEEAAAHDTKIEDLKQLILSKHEEDPDHKILLFSFFADTIEYIREEFVRDPRMQQIVSKAAFVSGRNRTAALDAASLFAPKAKDHHFKSGEEELTYLFSTDVLSEGQNLQDCGYLINYDLHWNPVRMVQRNGRINRLGSEFKTVCVQNFRPGKDLEAYLHLVERINQKIQLIKHVIGNDSSIFGEETDGRAYTDIYSEDSDVSTRSYEQLEDSLEVLTEDKYIQELREFRDNPDNAEAWREIVRIPEKTWGVFTNAEYDDLPVLNLAEAELGDGSKKLVFFGNTLEADSIDIVPIHQALDALSSTDSNRYSKSVLSVDQKEQSEAVQRRGANLVRGPRENAQLTPTQNTVIKLSIDYGFDATERDNLIKTLQTRNVNLRRKVYRSVRLINSKSKDNQPVQKEFQDLRLLLTDTDEKITVRTLTSRLGYQHLDGKLF